MPNVLVRDLDTAIIDRLKKRALRGGRSLQSEVQMILSEAAEESSELNELEVARIIRASIKNKKQTDSAELLREDRLR